MSGEEYITVKDRLKEAVQDISFIKISLIQIETKQEERDKTIFTSLEGITDKLNKFSGCPKGETNSKEIARIDTENKNNGKFIWSIFVVVVLEVIGVITLGFYKK